MQTDVPLAFLKIGRNISALDRSLRDLDVVTRAHTRMASSFGTLQPAPPEMVDIAVEDDANGLCEENT